MQAQVEERSLLKTGRGHREGRPRFEPQWEKFTTLKLEYIQKKKKNLQY